MILIKKQIMNQKIQVTGSIEGYDNIINKIEKENFENLVQKNIY